MSKKYILLFLLILIIASYFRFIGINWDQNQHLHPDERFLTMVAGAVSWPTSLSQYFDTASSPLNPHNAGFDFYVYGTYPVYLVKWLAQSLGMADYNHLTLVGREMSAVFDLGTLLLIFAITRKLTPKISIAVIASLLYAVSVLPIQLSHFFAVDPYLVFFITFSFYCLLYILEDSSTVPYAVLGITFGLAIAAKISAIYFLPIIALVFTIRLYKTKKIIRLVLSGIVFSLFLILTVRVGYPYLFQGPRFISFTLNPKVLANIHQLEYYDNPNVWFPPGTQWHTANNIVYPLENLLLWGLGLPLGLLSVLSLVYILIKQRRHPVFLCALWSLGLFVFQGTQYVKTLRYFYVIYPFLAITGAYFLFAIFNSKFGKPITALILILLPLWPLGFISIYSQPHSRVTATNWIYANIPAGSTLSCEYWDDCLPLGGSGPYSTIEYHLYDPDSREKWQQMQLLLNKTDYIILSSNRLYASIMTDPSRYPVTNEFYKALFDGRLGFQQVVEFTSRPQIKFPGLNICMIPRSYSYPTGPYGGVSKPPADCPDGVTFVDDYADESFTVYDHPKVTIFKKLTPVNFWSLIPPYQRSLIK